MQQGRLPTSRGKSSREVVAPVEFLVYVATRRLRRRAQEPASRRLGRVTFTLRLPGPVKLLALAAALWPVAWLVVFFTGSDAMAEEAWFAAGSLLTIVLIPSVALFFAMHAVLNPDLGSDRGVWIALVAFLGPVGMVTYWALYLWPAAGFGLGRQ